MTKAEFIEQIATRSKGALSKKAAAEIIESVFETVQTTLRREGRFSYPGFGTWSVRARKARQARHPQTGELITIKASKAVGFRPAKELRSRLK